MKTIKEFLKDYVNPQNIAGLWVTLAVLGVIEKSLPMIRDAREDIIGFSTSIFSRGA